MKKCPNCSYQFSTAENLILVFKSKLCPQCQTHLAHDKEQFVMERFFIIFPYAFLFAQTSTEQGLLAINNWFHLSLTRLQLLGSLIFAWCFIEVIAIFTIGKLIIVVPSPPFKEQLKQFMVYQPTFPNFKFKLSWLIPIGFFLVLIGLAVFFVAISNKIAGD